MPENDFEKQVEQMFEGFKMKPSDDVWRNVNERIREEKKDRKVIFWLPALLLLLLGGVGAYLKWGINNNNTKDIASQSIHSSIPDSSNKPVKENISKSYQGNNIAINENEETNNIKKSSIAITEKTNDTKNSNDGLSSGSSSPVSSTIKEKQANSQATVKQTGKKQSVYHEPLPVFKNADNSLKKSDRSATKIDKSVDHVLYSTKSKNEKYSDEVKKSETANHHFSGDASPQQVLLNQFILGFPAGQKYLSLLDKNSSPYSSVSTPVKLYKKKTWEFGVNTTAGVSKIGNGFSGIFNKFNVVENAAVMSDAQVLNNTTAGLVASGNNNYLAALPPSPTPVKPGFSWGVGASAKWHIKQRVALTAALSYTYNTTNREVGDALNNVSGNPQYNSYGVAVPASRYAGAYGNIGSMQYTNKYHLLEIPLGIQWQLNKGTGFVPVQLNTGVSIGWLINTDALHYDKVSGSYYDDKSLFNKMQAGLYAGLSVKLFQHSQRPLYIGPFVQYGVSNLLKSSDGTSQQLMFGGVKAEWILWRKK